MVVSGQVGFILLSSTGNRPSDWSYDTVLPIQVFQTPGPITVLHLNFFLRGANRLDLTLLSSDKIADI
jgi:hypothetical protein